MKKFIKYITIFILPILILMLLAEMLLRNIPNDYSYKSQYLDSNSNKIKALFLGSSHIYYGINPEIINQNYFNAGHLAQTLDIDFEILKKYQNNWNNLKYIIVPVDYLSFVSSLKDGSAEWRVKNYKIYYNINIRNKFTDNFEIFNGKLANNLNRIFRYYYKKESGIKCNNLGWGTLLNSSRNKNLLETGKIAARLHTAKNKLSLNSEITTALENIIMFADLKKIKVILISCPSYRTYVKNLDAKQLTSIHNFIKVLENKYTNVKYFNLLNDKTFIDKDFFDADHLNEIGTKKFTVKMDSIITQNTEK